MTIKNSFVAFFLIISINFIAGIELEANDLEYSIYINDNLMKVEYGYDNLNKEEYAVRWETINKINYINFYYDGLFLGKDIKHGNKRYLVLYSDYLIFYNNQNQAEFYISNRNYVGDLSSFTMTEISASSELKEKDIIYNATNLFSKRELKPWSEGVPGDGIGQRIRIEFTQSLTVGLNGLIISNGYIDYNKPYLYEYNNRIKKIRISYIGYNEYKDVELEDTPNYQYIHIGLDYKPSIVWIEILEVYKGSKWDDTCINSIFPYGI
jgi:hypothetical protein